MIKQVQEGNVLDLPNESEAITKNGGLFLSLGFVGMWNGGGKLPGMVGPGIVNGVIQYFLNSGASAIPLGSKLYLNKETLELELFPEVELDAEGAEIETDDYVYFGTVVKGSLKSNDYGKTWIKIKPQ